jgi:predicted permease
MILAGFLMVRSNWLTRAFWDGCEKLVYFLLFPALLFAAVVRANLFTGQTGWMVQIALMGMGLAALVGIATKWIPGLSRQDWASGIQCGFRFNTYVAFAVVARAFGIEGLALMAIIVGFAVPLANILAVTFLANTFHPLRLLKEMARNPLIIATVAGLIANLLHLFPPQPIYDALDRAGSASIALGLMCVGAGLSFAGIHRPANQWQTGLITAIKLLLFPGFVWGLCLAFGLTGLARDVVILFAAMPAASSCYILAARMNGNGPLAASLVSLSTLVSMLTISLWYALLVF